MIPLRNFFRTALIFATLSTASGAYLLSLACSTDKPIDPQEDFDSGPLHPDGSAETEDATFTVVEAGPGPSCVGFCAIQLVTGANHACALTTDSKVRCWGSNAFGQVGVAGASLFDVPTEVPLPALAKSVVAGIQHTCALLIDGSVYCWGYNVDGELGFAADSSPHVNPVQVGSFISSPIVQIAAGGYHTCARHSNLQLSCWGWNTNGEVGTGSKLSWGGYDPDVLPKPTVVDGLSGVEDVFAATTTTCVLLKTGVRCFGGTISGELGRNDPTLPTDVRPAPVVGLAPGIRQFSRSGGNHFLMAMQDGTAFGWGSNGSAELGPLDASAVFKPTAIAQLTDVQSISAGHEFSCATFSNKGAKCWGRNTVGQVGSLDAGNPALVPVPLAGLTNVYQVAASALDFACALTFDGQIYCWGANDVGQLGRGVSGTSPDPTPMKVKL